MKLYDNFINFLRDNELKYLIKWVFDIYCVMLMIYFVLLVFIFLILFVVGGIFFVSIVIVVCIIVFCYRSRKFVKMKNNSYIGEI